MLNSGLIPQSHLPGNQGFMLPETVGFGGESSLKNCILHLHTNKFCQDFFNKILQQVKNEKLVTDIGFKTKVTIEDILAMLKLWSCENPFMARYCYIFQNVELPILI